MIQNSVSVDGRMGWFSPDVGLYYEVATRWAMDASLSGSKTVLVGLGDLEAQEEHEGSDPTLEGTEPSASGPLMVVDNS
jgi:2,5-diamino-6-(ribosylamino)-4(3H)-pyrimidinone 5'-phosphate reductase